MSCKHDCPRPPAFPARIFNRPGLPRIDYRIGHYALVRAHLFDRLNAQPELAAWTHRGVDDPGIALLESDAVVVDILVFYQTLHANEAYLRTAQWRESVADLVRLGGYRLAPGVAGEATFALSVKGDKPVDVAPGFGLNAQLQDIEKPVEFETDAALQAFPAFSRFSLYRPRTVPPLQAGAQVLCFDAIDVELKAQDRLYLAAAQPAAGDNAQLLDGETVTVEETWEAFGLRFARLQAPLRRATPAASLRAYKLGERFAHFGHNAPDTLATVTAQGMPSTRAVSFLRPAQAATTLDVDPDLGAREVALDRGFDRIVAGDIVLVQGRFAATAGGATQRVTLARRVTDTETRALRWGSLSGSATVLTLAQDLLAGGPALPYGDVRTLQVLQAQGAAFTVRAAEADSIATAGDLLRYYGPVQQARALTGRRLLLLHPDGRTDDRVVQAVLPGPRDPGFHGVRLSAPVDYADFGYEGETAMAYGNVVEASQGKTLERAPIGSGDARVAFQTFALPKSPLTYRFDASAMPAQTPALEVYVDGVRWKRVDTLFGRGAQEQVYIVREDAEGRSAIQFGDGKTGTRPASGRDNIVAGYRVGSGAHGALKPDTKPQATGRLAALDKVFLPLEVDTGAVPEDAGAARRAAPLRLQSLGRLVSLADYEAETRMLPNVVKAGARWDAPDGVPAIVLTVLTASGSEADLAAIAQALKTFSHCRGPARHPFRAIRGLRQFVRVRANVGHDGSRTPEAMTADIQHVLGAAGVDGAHGDALDGLFGLDRRDFHASVHGSEVIAAIQRVPGVSWVELQALYPIPLGMPPQTDPRELDLPAVEPPPAALLPCPARALLSLHARHLTLGFASAAIAKECGP